MNITKTVRFLRIPNKYLEIQLTKFSDTNFEINLTFSTKGDHAGIRFYLNLWKYVFLINLYDSRHWDWENDRWESVEKVPE